MINDNQQQVLTVKNEFRKEVARKGLHILIGFLPIIALQSYFTAYTLLISGACIYTLSELIRIRWNGDKKFFPYKAIRGISLFVSRPGEAKHFIIAPLTLAVGAGLTLFFFPENAMKAGILALAFGDTAAALAGKFFFRKNRKKYGVKTITGTAACFITSTLCVWLVVNDWTISLAAGAVASLCEMTTLKDFDNILVPLGTAAVVLIMS
ncbi:MAG: hypothetical protein HQ557_14850 [Bacteroidetes bacterium]|nr:hypothetical protein [Bacteroidota bacterium]